MALYGDGMLEINNQMFMLNDNQIVDDVKLLGFELF